MQALAQLIIMLLITLPILSGCCEKSILSWCRFIFNISVKLPQLAFWKFQEVLMYGLLGEGYFGNHRLMSRSRVIKYDAFCVRSIRLSDLQLWHSEITN